MPIFHSSAGTHDCDIYYEIRGDVDCNGRHESKACSTSYGDRPDVVLIMGLAATHNCWEPQMDEFLRSRTPGGPSKARVLLLDNRGVGRSGCPKSRAAYSTTAMATDIISLLDHLGWGKVHVVGHSMGAMVSAKLAALFPDRVSTLALVSATGGGWEALPKTWASFKIALQILTARTARQRAWLDLQLHFNKKTLSSVDDRYGRTREELLHEDYLEGAEGGGPGQDPDGFKGQVWAVLKHRLSDKEIGAIRQADVPVMVLHGRHDILALPKYGERLARRFEAPCVMLEGAHMLCRERGPEVNLLLHHLIFHGRRLKDTQHKFLVGEPDPRLDGLGAGGKAASSCSDSPQSSADRSEDSAHDRSGSFAEGQPSMRRQLIAE